MVRVEKSKTVNAPQEKIFALITDFEKLPSRFPNRYRNVKVIERSGNIVTVKKMSPLRVEIYIRSQGTPSSRPVSLRVR